MDFTVIITDPCSTATLSFRDRNADFPESSYTLRGPDMFYPWVLAEYLLDDTELTVSCDYSSRAYQLVNTVETQLDSTVFDPITMTSFSITNKEDPSIAGFY